MTKIIDETGRDTQQERNVIEFVKGIKGIIGDDGTFKPTVKPYQCEEIRLLVKSKSSIVYDIMLARCENNTYVYLGHWNDGIIK